MINYINFFFGEKQVQKIFLGSNIDPFWQHSSYLKVPTLLGTYTYNGSEQSVAISPYDSSKISISGNKATNAGTYTVTFHLIDSTESYWIDGSTEDKTATWSIGKARATMTKPISKTGIIALDSEQTLVTAGSAIGGTIYYGLGESTTSPPNSWSTSLPTGTNAGNYYVWSKVIGDNNHKDVTQAYACTVNIIATKRVGGRIFYIDISSSGNTYKFYNSSGQELTTQTVNGLTDAVYYIKSGSAKDKFYVFDNTTHTTGDQQAFNGKVYDIMWGYHGIATGATDDTIGSGKTNTNKVLTMVDTSGYSNSIFEYAKACRNEKLNGCDDWFILSRAEQNKLRESGLISYTSDHFWSSVEDVDSYYAYYWHYGLSNWTVGTKFDDREAFVARAF